MKIYEEASNVWRPFQEMDANLLLALFFPFILSAWTAFVFTQATEPLLCFSSQNYRKRGKKRERKRL